MGEMKGTNAQHALKINEECLMNLKREKKKVEIRINDRDYQVGDILKFWHWMFNSVYYKITHVHSGYGMEKGFVALSVEETEVL